MSQNRTLDPDEIGGLLTAGNRDNKHKPKLCKNDKCNNTFIPKRVDQVFCCERCRLTAGHARNVTNVEDQFGRMCAWCGANIPEEKQSSAKFCSSKCRALAFKAKPCIYCGDIANSRDHFIPRAFVKRIEDLGWADKDNIIVPACTECNSTAGSKVFATISEKRKYIHEQYKKKYKKLLEMPSWTEDELEEYGHSLRTHIKHSLTAKDEIRARLRWPKV